MRIIASGGGTGGHVYPALAVLDSLNRGRQLTTSSDDIARQETGSILYVGHRSGMEAELVQKEGLAFQGIASGPLRGRRPWETAWNILKIGMGLGQALALISRFKPDVILATGGYVCVPVVVAGWMRGVPSLVYLPDLAPGMAVKFLSHFATRIAVSFDETTHYFPANKVTVTGYPVRPQLTIVNRDEGRTRLGLPADAKVVLLLGGSRGATSINNAVAESLTPLLEMANVVHICGGEKGVFEQLESRRDDLDSRLQERYHLYPYLHREMGCALAAANIVVSRAGASVMGEYPAFALPSVLVPYPHAGAHQELNAHYLVNHGAAVRLGDEELRQGRLLEVLRSLIEDETRLAEMSKKAKQLARPNAAEAIGNQLQDLARAK